MLAHRPRLAPRFRTRDFAELRLLTSGTAETRTDLPRGVMVSSFMPMNTTILMKERVARVEHRRADHLDAAPSGCARFQ